jgi:hypothetical protein
MPKLTVTITVTDPENSFASSTVEFEVDKTELELSDDRYLNVPAAQVRDIVEFWLETQKESRSMFDEDEEKESCPPSPLGARVWLEPADIDNELDWPTVTQLLAGSGAVFRVTLSDNTVATVAWITAAENGEKDRWEVI